MKPANMIQLGTRTVIAGVFLSSLLANAEDGEVKVASETRSDRATACAAAGKYLELMAIGKKLVNLSACDCSFEEEKFMKGRSGQWTCTVKGTYK